MPRSGVIEKPAAPISMVPARMPGMMASKPMFSILTSRPIFSPMALTRSISKPWTAPVFESWNSKGGKVAEVATLRVAAESEHAIDRAEAKAAAQSTNFLIFITVVPVAVEWKKSDAAGMSLVEKAGGQERDRRFFAHAERRVIKKCALWEIPTGACVQAAFKADLRQLRISRNAEPLLVELVEGAVSLEVLQSLVDFALELGVVLGHDHGEEIRRGNGLQVRRLSGKVLVLGKSVTGLSLMTASALPASMLRMASPAELKVEILAPLICLA